MSESGVASAGELLALAALDQELAADPAMALWLLAETLTQTGAEQLTRRHDMRLLRVEPGRREGVDRVPFFSYGPSRVALVTALRLVAPTRLLQEVNSEGAALIEDRRADFSFTVLLGGGAACASFDCVVPLDRFGAAVAARGALVEGELARRIDHVAGMFLRADMNARDAENARQTSDAERFSVEYLSLLEDAAPSLRCPDVTSIPLETLTFHESALPAWPFMPPVRLVHSLRQGVAAIRFTGWGAEIEGLAGIMEPSLTGTDYMLARSEVENAPRAPDALLIASTPRVDPIRPLDGQYDAAREGIGQLRDLQRWYESRRAAARYWAEFCEPHKTRSSGARVLRDVAL